METKQNENQVLEFAPSEWDKIRDFCENGQNIIKPSSFGYHERKLSIKEDKTLSWQTKSIPLDSIHTITIGNPPKKLFRKESNAKSLLWMTITTNDRDLYLLFPDIQSRNFWIKSITIYMSKLTSPSNPLYIESIKQLTNALKLQSTTTTIRKTAQIKYTINGKVKPIIIDINSDNDNPDIPSRVPSHIDIPKSDETYTDSINDVCYVNMVERQQQDIFKNVASGKSQKPIQNESIQSTLEFPSSSTLFKTLSTNIQHIQQSPNNIETIDDMNMIPMDVETITSCPDIKEIKSNLHKLYVFVNNDNNLNNNSDELENVYVFNIDEMLSSNTKVEEENIQIIENEIDNIYCILYNYNDYSNNDNIQIKQKQIFTCIVLPSLDHFKLNIEKTCPVVYEYLQQKLNWLIRQIDNRNSELSISPKLNTVITPVHIQDEDTDRIVTQQVLSRSPSLFETEQNTEQNVESIPKQSKSPSRDIAKSNPIPHKLLRALGVDRLHQLTISLMKNGEIFKMYYESGSAIVSKIYLNSNCNGLIGDDLAILFSNIVSLYGGKYNLHPDVNPSASFIIEYKLDNTSTKCVLLEIIKEEKYLSIRNWWINSIISCIAHNKPYRVPPSISSLTKILNSITFDNELYKLHFVDVNDIDDTISISTSFDLHNQTVSSDVSSDAEIARQKALQRVKKYKKLQKDIELITKKSKNKANEKLKQIQKSIDIETIKFSPTNTHQSEYSHKSEDQDEQPTSPNTNVINMDKLLNLNQKQQHQIDSNTKQNVHHSVNTEPIQLSSNTPNLVQFVKEEDATKMRTTISQLVNKILLMEQLQTTQTEKVQQFIIKETAAFKKYESDIKKLKKRNRHLENENNKLKSQADIAHRERSNLEKTIKVEQWEKSKNIQYKNKKLKKEIIELNEENNKLQQKLEKAESAYNAAIQNYHREMKHKDKFKKEYIELKKEYMHNTQNLKKELISVIQKNNEYKKNSKSLRKSLNYCEKNENKFHTLLKAEINRSTSFETQLVSLQKQLNDERQQYQQNSGRIQESVKLTKNDTNLISKQNKHLQQENQKLCFQIQELHNLYQEQEIQLKNSQQEINKLHKKQEKLTNKLKEKEKMYQQKLLDFTQYAQEQMNIQQQMLMNQNKK